MHQEDKAKITKFQLRVQDLEARLHASDNDINELFQNSWQEFEQHFESEEPSRKHELLVAVQEEASLTAIPPPKLPLCPIAASTPPSTP